MKKLLIGLLSLGSLVAFADSYQVPSAISCKNARFELSLENTRAKPGQVSGEGSGNMIGVVDTEAQTIAHQVIATGFYYPDDKIYTYRDAKGKLVLSVKTKLFDRRADVIYYGGTEFGSTSFKKCRVYMVKPSSDQWQN